MKFIINLLNLLTLLLAPVIILLGYLNRPDHMIFGFLYAIVFIGSSILSMFYFIATGAAIKSCIFSYGLQPEFYLRTRAFKKSIFPATFTSAVLIVVAGIYGGAVANKLAPGWLHSLFSWSAILLFAYATVKQYQAIPQNEAILSQVNSQIRDREPDDEIAKD